LFNDGFNRAVRPLSQKPTGFEENRNACCLHSGGYGVNRSKDRPEEKKTAITAPARKAAQEAAALFSEVEKGLESAETHLKQLLADYIDERLPAAAQEAATAVNAGDKTALQAALTALPNVDGIGLSTETSFDIIDFDAIPKQYLKVEIDRKAILTALRKGIDIPGITEKNRTRISVTVK
jgi:hypothetical protein